MEKNKDDYYSLSELVNNLKFFFHYVKSKWFVFLALVLGIIGLGIIYYFIQKPKYQATCVFILEEKQSSLGGLGSLASQFGFDLGGGGGSLFAGDNILEILKSSAIIKSVLLSRVDTASDQRLIDLYIDISQWKNKWVDDARLKDISFRKIPADATKLTLLQDSVLALVHTALIKKQITVERVTKKGSLMNVSVVSENQVFSKLMSERIVDRAKEMYVQLKTTTATANINRLESKADSLLRLLNSKSYQVAGATVIDANPGLRSAIVPTELVTRDKAVLQTLYSEIVKNLEVSRTALMQQTPVIQVIDAPAYPLIWKKKGLVLLIIVSGLIGCIIATLLLFIRFFLGKKMKKVVAEI